MAYLVTKLLVRGTGLAGTAPPPNNCALVDCCTTRKHTLATGPRMSRVARNTVSVLHNIKCYCRSDDDVIGLYLYGYHMVIYIIHLYGRMTTTVGEKELLINHGTLCGGLLCLSMSVIGIPSCGSSVKMCIKNTKRKRKKVRELSPSFWMIRLNA